MRDRTSPGGGLCKLLIRVYRMVESAENTFHWHAGKTITYGKHSIWFAL
jgi:hypothetical protein